MAFGRTLPPWFGRQSAPPVDPSMMGMLPQVGPQQPQFTAGQQIAPAAAPMPPQGLSREDVMQRRTMADTMAGGSLPLSQVRDPWTAAAYAAGELGSAWTEKRARTAEDKQKAADRKALAEALAKIDRGEAGMEALSQLDIPEVQDMMTQAKFKDLTTPKGKPEDVDGDGRPDGIRLPDGTLRLDPRTAAQEDAAKINYYRQTTGADAAASRQQAARLSQQGGGGLARSAEQRAQLAKTYGIDPASAAGRKFILTGQLPEDPANKPMNDEQAKAAGFAKRIKDANSVLEDPGRQAALLSTSNNFGASVPVLSNQLVSSDYQEADQAVRDFINAQLRRESGAVIADSEFANARAQYIPVWGDGPKVLERKRLARIRALENLYVSSGPRGAQDAAQTAATRETGAADGWKIEEVK